MDHPLVAQLGEMLHCQLHAGALVPADVRKPSAGSVPVDENGGNSVVGDLLQQRVLPPGRGDDEAIGAAGAKLLHLPSLGVGVVVGVGQHQGVAGQAEHLFGRAHHRGNSGLVMSGTTIATTNDLEVRRPRARVFGT